MVRKQLYIEERQERALKRRAKALGISEADIVRQALDAVLVAEGEKPVGARHLEALHAVLETALQVSRGHRLVEDVRREDLYEEREGRWARP